MTAEKRVQLRGVLAQTSSTAAVDGGGNLVVELYDFSAEAHRWLGNDVAFMLHLDVAGKRAMLAALLGGEPAPDAPDPDALLLGLVQERFSDYYAVKQWLEEHGIPFRKEFEPWA